MCNSIVLAHTPALLCCLRAQKDVEHLYDGSERLMLCHRRDHNFLMVVAVSALEDRRLEGTVGLSNVECRAYTLECALWGWGIKGCLGFAPLEH